MLGPEMLKEVVQEVITIKQNIKTTQDKKKSYVDKHKMHKEFKVGEHVYRKVKPQRSFLKLETCSMVFIFIEISCNAFSANS